MNKGNAGPYYTHRSLGYVERRQKQMEEAKRNAKDNSPEGLAKRKAKLKAMLKD